VRVMSCDDPFAFPRAAISVQCGARERAPDSLLDKGVSFQVQGRPRGQKRTRTMHVISHENRSLGTQF